VKKIFLPLLILSTLVLSQKSLASPFVCISQTSTLGLNQTEQAIVMRAALSCKSVSQFQSGLKVGSIIFGAAGIWAACTGVGAPAAVWLEGGALGIEIVNLSVGFLPCEETQSKESIRKMAREAICEELQRNGVDCRG
jgi:hypothetical protein